MKQKLHFFLLAFIIQISLPHLSTAQSVKGSNFINAGIGLGTFGLSGTGGTPITISVEHGFSDKISAGIIYEMVHTTFDNEWKYNYYVFGARGSYHLNEALNVKNKNLDLYGGVTLFYRGYSIKYTGSASNFVESGSTGGVDFAIHAGAHYYFGSSVGGFAELGYGISPLQIGLTFKL